MKLIINSKCNLWIYANRCSGSFMKLQLEKVNGTIISFNKIKRINIFPVSRYALFKPHRSSREEKKSNQSSVVVL